MSTSREMGLTIWDLPDDLYDHTQLAINFTAIDGHDHTSGRGKRIITASIQDQAVTSAKIADANVTTPKIADANVTNPKLADGSVNPRTLANSSVTTLAIADRSVTSTKLADDIVPLGTVISWWRPNDTTPLPGGWVAADGATLIAANHDFIGGGSIQLPDLRNKFILGAAIGGTGTGPDTPPSIRQQGGSNQANLSHTHEVPHSHNVNGHNHGVNPHSHTVDPHTHVLNNHNHTVNSHTHVVGGHAHSSSHSHTMYHIHRTGVHAHGIYGDGSHGHTYGGGYPIFSRGGYMFSDSSGVFRQALYIAGFNAGNTSNYAPTDSNGGHSHYGGTAYSDGNVTTEGTLTPSTASTTTTSDPNANFASGAATPDTNGVGGSTLEAHPATSSDAGTTATSTTSTSTDTPPSTPGLVTQDIRPAYVGLLQLIKVKH